MSSVLARDWLAMLVCCAASMGDATTPSAAAVEIGLACVVSAGTATFFQSAPGSTTRAINDPIVTSGELSGFCWNHTVYTLKRKKRQQKHKKAGIPVKNLLTKVILCKGIWKTHMEWISQNPTQKHYYREDTRPLRYQYFRQYSFLFHFKSNNSFVGLNITQQITWSNRVTWK